MQMNPSRRSFMQSVGALAGGAVIIARLPEVKAENLPVTVPDVETKELVRLHKGAVPAECVIKEIYPHYEEYWINGLSAGGYVLDFFTPFLVENHSLAYLERSGEDLKLKINGLTFVHLPLNGERVVTLYQNLIARTSAGSIAQHFLRPMISKIKMEN
jgi:hypothetical protein